MDIAKSGYRDFLKIRVKLRQILLTCWEKKQINAKLKLDSKTINRKGENREKINLVT